MVLLCNLFMIFCTVLFHFCFKSCPITFYIMYVNARQHNCHTAIEAQSALFFCWSCLPVLPGRAQSAPHSADPLRPSAACRPSYSSAGSLQVCHWASWTHRRHTRPYHYTVSVFPWQQPSSYWDFAYLVVHFLQMSCSTVSDNTIFHWIQHD